MGGWQLLTKYKMSCVVYTVAMATVLLKGNVALARHFYAQASNTRHSCLAILAYVTCIKSASVE